MQGGPAILLLLSTLSQSSGLHLSPRCDADWKKFGTYNFHETARVTKPAHHDVSFRTYHDHRFGLQGLFVHPDSHFAFCLIEKNGCTVLSKAFNTLLPEGHRAHADYNVSKVSQKLYGWRAMDQVFEDPKATRAVFVRDPMVRFVSAFVNKCIEGEDMHVPFKSCPLPRGSVFSDAVEWALHNEFIDGHWLPQALHCELSTRVHQYTVVGYMTPETFSRDVSCVLQQAGLQNISKIAHANESPKSGLTEEDILKRFFTPDAARRLIDRYRVDYQTFRFDSYPEWIKHATGEWYEKVPSSPGVLQLSRLGGFHLSSDAVGANQGHLAEQTDDHDDEDSIVTLAVRAGFLD